MRPVRIVRVSAGRVTVSAEGLRVFNDQGEVLAEVVGDSAALIRIAADALAAARELRAEEELR